MRASNLLGRRKYYEDKYLCLWHEAIKKENVVLRRSRTSVGKMIEFGTGTLIYFASETFYFYYFKLQLGMTVFAFCSLLLR